MVGTKKLFTLAMCLVLLMVFAAPAFAQTRDREVTRRDLTGVPSPRRHRWLTSTLGGAAIGAGIGVLIGHKTEFVKGMLIGGGGGSALYLHSHPRTFSGGMRDWAFIGSHAALGTGLGWTLCGCNDGAVAGLLVGGGASAWWRASLPDRRNPPVATTNP
jgi:hypothetical protein